MIKRLVRKSFTAIAALSLMTPGLMLTGCGGSSGGSSAGGTPEVVSGTAAVGTPMTGKVSLKDSSTPPLQKSTDINETDGSFAIDVTSMKAPFVLQAKGSVDGTEYTLHSFAEGTGTANINPLSNAIVASAAGDDDPSDVFEKAHSDKNHKIKTNFAKTVSTLLAKLEPLLKQYRSEHTNPITTRYVSHHLDLDDMYKNVKITIANGILSIINTKTKAVIFSGNVSDIANGIFDGGAVPPVASAPAAPTSLTAVGGAGQMTLSWTTVSDATSYNVYYATTSNVTKTSGTKITSPSNPYIQTGLATGTTYYYIVTAVNSGGESAASTQTSAGTASTPPVATVPAAPTAVSAKGGTNQVTISWPAVSGAASYNIYWSTTTGITKTSGTKVTAATSPYIKTGLIADTAYYFIVSAVNATGEGAASAQVNATAAATPVLDGLALYNANCVSCHGTSKLGKTAAATQGAINANTGGMGYLSTLTTAQVAAIASTTAPVIALDGAALYNANCSGCHGTSKRGKTVAATQGAIVSNRGGMGYLSTLTAAELTAISLY